MHMKILYKVTLNASFSWQGLSSVLGESQIPLTKLADFKNVLHFHVYFSSLKKMTISFCLPLKFKKCLIKCKKGMWFSSITKLKILQFCNFILPSLNPNLLYKC